MPYNNCICLSCSRIVTVAVSSTSEVENVVCPTCGKKRLVTLQPESVFSGGG